MKFVLDTGILGRLCHPNKKQNKPVSRWLAELLDGGPEVAEIVLPEIADYELRRKLIHLIRTGRAEHKSLDRLDDITKFLDYLPLCTETMRKAAVL